MLIFYCFMLMIPSTISQVLVSGVPSCLERGLSNRQMAKECVKCSTFGCSMKNSGFNMGLIECPEIQAKAWELIPAFNEQECFARVQGISCGVGYTSHVCTEENIELYDSDRHIFELSVLACSECIACEVGKYKNVTGNKACTDCSTPNVLSYVAGIDCVGNYATFKLDELSLTTSYFVNYTKNEVITGEKSESAMSTGMSSHCILPLLTLFVFALLCPYTSHAVCN